MKARILVFQFRFNDAGIEAEKSALTRVLGKQCELVFRNALSDKIDWNHPKKLLQGFRGVILPGSAELSFDGGLPEEHRSRTITSSIAREIVPFIQYLIDNDVPTLGICFGHQLLGYAAGAQVRHSPREGKTGSVPVILEKEGERDPLFTGFSKKFLAQYMHKDALDVLPEGSVVLARNPDKCSYAALRLAPHVYSVQFHPERSREDCIAAAKRSSEYMPANAKPEEIFQETRESENVLMNFATITMQ